MLSDNPQVRIEVSGIEGAGKSILISQFRLLLLALGVPFDGPVKFERRSAEDLAKAIENLRRRGLRAEFVETQTGRRPQIDATGNDPKEVHRRAQRLYTDARAPGTRIHNYP